MPQHQTSSFTNIPQLHSRSCFTYGQTEGVIHLTDLSGIKEMENVNCKTLTNDMDAVLNDLHRHLSKELSFKKIIYLDTDKNWIGVHAFNNGTYERPQYSCRFYNPTPGTWCRNLDDAIRAARYLEVVNGKVEEK